MGGVTEREFEEKEKTKSEALPGRISWGKRRKTV